MRDNKPVIEGMGLYLCDLDRLCVRECPEEALILEPDETRYFFRIESNGQLSIKEIFQSAFLNIDLMFDSFENALKKALEGPSSDQL